MKLATIADGTPDGRLVVVSADGTRIVDAGPVAATLQQALEGWIRLGPQLAALGAGSSEPGSGVTFAAPLPRAWQWLDGSAFTSHGELMQIAFDIAPLPPGPPLMYQGLSDRFLGPHRRCRDDRRGARN